ncbi:NfeD family protein [Denitromonas ohlonensis]|uniref:Nodulation protein NfeD n=2 Tax=Denitromonas TaxID=139331 RepID=A0A557SG57_9RHOO|nr:nodulation protein NfeD [Denitromonas ohlonensis]TVO67548.1 nodulation protein NfeD [Denitromonas ohlonensis]TVO76407.1 nodulation protein NfeD [Denitromonas ohlonensis]
MIRCDTARFWMALRHMLMMLALFGVMSAQAATVRVLQVDGVIGPASADFILQGLADVGEVEAVVIALDTPGGLDTSMRQIIKAILASPVPVITYVSPEGARAASAGTFILYASHLAAMTPATNLGAASPVAVGMPGGTKPTPKPGDAATDPAEPAGKADGLTPSLGADTLARKATNDATAYIRSLAELRGRNVEFAEKAVREAASLSAEAALREGVIDVIAADVPDLLKQIDGREVTLPSGKRALQTAGAAIDTQVPDWRHQALAVLANPQLALVLMMIGFYGLFVEFTSPGFGVPGVAGAICLLLAMYAFQMLPINWAGVGLVALGLVLMTAEVFLPSFGVLGIGGIAAMVLGGLFLIDKEAPGFAVSLPFIVGTAVAAAGLIFLAGTLFLKSRGRPLASGAGQLLGRVGEVTAIDGAEAWAHVDGEQWQVRSGQPLSAGQRIRITAIDGLVLSVEPIDSGSPS